QGFFTHINADHCLHSLGFLVSLTKTEREKTIGALSILMQALGLYGTLQSDNRKRKGIVMLDRLTRALLYNKSCSFLSSLLYKLISFYKHRIV
ncbi:hypothetical protein, partial [Rufibacter quisquiliarum]|uniref:hypothetical protein n=1 Tax=Rufibacter quisquiliarum TaxID=1549639 RepID=UPI001C7254D0